MEGVRHSKTILISIDHNLYQRLFPMVIEPSIIAEIRHTLPHIGDDELSRAGGNV